LEESGNAAAETILASGPQSKNYSPVYDVVTGDHDAPALFPVFIKSSYDASHSRGTDSDDVSDDEAVEAERRRHAIAVKKRQIREDIRAMQSRLLTDGAKAMAVARGFKADAEGDV